MNIQKIRGIAKKMGIEPQSLDKKGLIRAIQIGEGNSPCFKTDLPACTQVDCCWRNDCKPGRMTAS